MIMKTISLRTKNKEVTDDLDLEIQMDGTRP